MKVILAKDRVVYSGSKIIFKHALLSQEFYMIKRDTKNHFNILKKLALFVCPKKKRLGVRSEAR